MHKKIIVDFDNTFTLDGHDIDDIIALLYLLSCKNIEVPFVCTTFGNSTLENVNECTERFFNRIDTKLKIYSGNKKITHLTENERIEYAKTNKAAIAILKYIEQYPYEVDLLALGSLHNFADTFLLAPRTITKIKSFTAMGGITAPLIFNKTEMNELNFSVDYVSSELVLKNFPHPNIITGNNCIKHCYNINHLDVIPETNIINILYEPIKHWLHFFKTQFNFSGNVLWDVIAAMYVAEPENFLDEIFTFELSADQLKEGKLIQSQLGTKLNLPSLKSNDNFYTNIFTQISMLKF